MSCGLLLANELFFLNVNPLSKLIEGVLDHGTGLMVAVSHLPLFAVKFLLVN